jgi:hypothetical protein
MHTNELRLDYLFLRQRFIRVKNVLLFANDGRILFSTKSSMEEDCYTLVKTVIIQVTQRKCVIIMKGRFNSLCIN